MKHVGPSIRMILFMTFLTGVAYPLAVTSIGQILFYDQANGNLVKSGDVVLGSNLVAQNFEGPRYFWPRPSGAGFNPLPSGASNLGPISADLKKAFEERKTKLKAAHPWQGEPPQDLLFASGSGLDPEISPEAARYQISRISKARGMSLQQVSQMVDAFTEGRQLGVLGEPRVHVLRLNIALDESQGIKIAPVYVAPVNAPQAPTNAPPPAGPPSGGSAQ